MSDRLLALAEWVDNRPRWLRPALYGAGLVYMYAWSSGVVGGFLAVAALVVLFASGRQSEAWHYLLAVTVIAPAGGFLGGLVYTAFEPVGEHFGGIGRFIQRVAAGMGYATVLVLAILPLFRERPGLEPAFSPLDDFVVISLIGLCIGASMSVSDRDAEGGEITTNWRFVGGVIVVGAFLAMLMYLAGWMS